MPPGNYEFSVRATNGDKVWSDRETTLRIRVRPPWWNTTMAYVAYLLLIAGAVYAVYFIANERIEQRRSLLIESMNRAQQRESYEAKLRFFTSIAHEFCTPLTLIYGSGEQLLGSYSLAPEVVRHVRIIRNNAARMQRLIGELMDFRRVDTGHYEPRFAEVDAAELLSSIVDNFNEVNEQRRIDLRVALPAAGVVIVSDRDALEKILYNLVSNAYKYTPKGGWIEVALEASAALKNSMTARPPSAASKATIAGWRKRRYSRSSSASDALPIRSAAENLCVPVRFASGTSHSYGSATDGASGYAELVTLPTHRRSVRESHPSARYSNSYSPQ